MVLCSSLGVPPSSSTVNILLKNNKNICFYRYICLFSIYIIFTDMLFFFYLCKDHLFYVAFWIWSKCSAIFSYTLFKLLSRDFIQQTCSFHAFLVSFFTCIELLQCHLCYTRFFMIRSFSHLFVLSFYWVKVFDFLSIPSSFLLEAHNHH